MKEMEKGWISIREDMAGGEQSGSKEHSKFLDCM